MVDGGQAASSAAVRPSMPPPGGQADGYEYGYCVARHDPSWGVVDEAARRGHPGRPVLDATRTRSLSAPAPAPAASAGAGDVPTLVDADDQPDLTDGSDTASVDTR